MDIPILSTLIQGQFRQTPGLLAVLLFGSQIMGTARPDSDIDLAVLYDYNFIPTTMELWEIKEAISEKLQMPVDLICLNNADTIIASQVLKNHKVLLVNDQKKLSEYFMRILIDYAELKELRKAMEDTILQREWDARS